MAREPATFWYLPQVRSFRILAGECCESGWRNLALFWCPAKLPIPSPCSTACKSARYQLSSSRQAIRTRVRGLSAWRHKPTNCSLSSLQSALSWSCSITKLVSGVCHLRNLSGSRFCKLCLPSKKRELCIKIYKICGKAYHIMVSGLSCNSISGMYNHEYAPYGKQR